jgi:hypothetical protein
MNILGAPSQAAVGIPPAARVGSDAGRAAAHLQILAGLRPQAGGRTVRHHVLPELMSDRPQSLQISRPGGPGTVSLGEGGTVSTPHPGERKCTRAGRSLRVCDQHRANP